MVIYKKSELTVKTELDFRKFPPQLNTPSEINWKLISE